MRVWSARVHCLKRIVTPLGPNRSNPQIPPVFWRSVVSNHSLYPLLHLSEFNCVQQNWLWLIKADKELTRRMSNSWTLQGLESQTHSLEPCCRIDPVGTPPRLLLGLACSAPAIRCQSCCPPPTLVPKRDSAWSILFNVTILGFKVRVISSVSTLHGSALRFKAGLECKPLRFFHSL